MFTLNILTLNLEDTDSDDPKNRHTWQKKMADTHGKQKRIRISSGNSFLKLKFKTNLTHFPHIQKWKNWNKSKQKWIKICSTTFYVYTLYQTN